MQASAADAFELHPAVVAAARPVGRVEPFGDNALQAVLDGTVEERREFPGFVDDLYRGHDDDLTRNHQPFKPLTPHLVSERRDVLTVHVQHVEREEPERQRLRRGLDAVFAPPPDRLLKRQVLVGERL